MKSRKCPCCGHPLPTDKAPGYLRGYQRRIFEIVSRASPQRISMQDLIGKLYEDRSDGGPEAPEICVKRQVFNINRKIVKDGLVIRGQRGAKSEGYALYEKA